jgi:hypothetical protein
MHYASQEEYRSEVRPGVSYLINRISFGRRIDLMRRVRDLVPKLECFQAGDSTADRVEATLISAEIDRLYLEWGLLEVRGLEIDGAPATPESLAEYGPEDLFVEALRFVKQASGLSESETKN